MARTLNSRSIVDYAFFREAVAEALRATLDGMVQEGARPWRRSGQREGTVRARREQRLAHASTMEGEFACVACACAHVHRRGRRTHRAHLDGYLRRARRPPTPRHVFAPLHRSRPTQRPFNIRSNRVS